MKNKLIFNKIFFIICLVLFISILTLIILGNISRKGYLSELQLNESLSTQGNYSYNFRIKYYSKLFRNSDIYGVYIDTNKVIQDNSFLKEIKFDYKGSPFGILTSTKELNTNDKIDNINYKLKIKLLTLILFLILILFIYIVIYSIIRNKIYLLFSSILKNIIKLLLEFINKIKCFYLKYKKHIFIFYSIITLVFLLVIIVISNIKCNSKLIDLELIAESRAGYVYKAKIENYRESKLFYIDNNSIQINNTNNIKYYGYSLEISNKPLGSWNSTNIYYTDNNTFIISNESTNLNAYYYNIQVPTYVGNKYKITILAKQFPDNGVIKWHLNSINNFKEITKQEISNDYIVLTDTREIYNTAGGALDLHLIFPQGVTEIKSILIENLNTNLYSENGYIILTYDKVIKDLQSYDVNFNVKLNLNLFYFILLVIIFIYFCIIYKYVFMLFFNNKYRFAAAAIVFILCIIFEISGSSTGIYSSWLNIESGVIFGKSRSIRGDEWKVLTPFMLSQYENHTGKFPYFSDTIRGDKTDAYIIAQSPVMDISILFRLFQIGFLFLPPAKGLSFFWMGRIIALFLVSFEIMKLITNKNNKLSLFGAILITFAPSVNWWFSTYIIEIIIFASLSAIFFYFYFKEERFIYRILYIALIFISCGNLLFTLYPAWQVPFGYLLLSLYIWIIIENWKTFDIKTKKKDFIIWAVFFIIFILLVGRIFIKSKETIELVRNTAYPGKRFNTGGGIFLELFRWAINLFTPYNEYNIIKNTCELSAFIDFFPIPYIFAAYLIFKQKVRDKLLIILSICSLFIFVYMTIGFPIFLSKISLLLNSTSGRTVQVFGIINIFILIRSLYLYKPNLKIVIAVILSVLFSLFIILVSYKYQDKYLTSFMVIILFISLSIICLSFLKYKNNFFRTIFLFSSSLFLIISSIYINPIQKGLGIIYNSNLYKSIKEISSNDNGLWVSTIWYLHDFPIIAGAPTINSVNTYPNFNRWKILDPELKYKDIYNRYAHINVNILNNNNFNIDKFQLLTPDSFQLNITLDDLRKINTKYILSDINLENFNTENIKLNLIKQVDNFFIYSIVE